ncbi:MAG: hypothetical protein H7A40_05890 [Chlamydiales bacterium]|nr:hypothetical protein [Chlamydiales bacterium]
MATPGNRQLQRYNATLSEASQITPPPCCSHVPVIAALKEELAAMDNQYRKEVADHMQAVKKMCELHSKVEEQIKVIARLRQEILDKTGENQ